MSYFQKENLTPNNKMNRLQIKQSNPRLDQNEYQTDTPTRKKYFQLQHIQLDLQRKDDFSNESLCYENERRQTFTPKSFTPNPKFYPKLKATPNTNQKRMTISKNVNFNTPNIQREKIISLNSKFGGKQEEFWISGEKYFKGVTKKLDYD